MSENASPELAAEVTAPKDRNPYQVGLWWITWLSLGIGVIALISEASANANGAYDEFGSPIPDVPVFGVSGPFLTLGLLSLLFALHSAAALHARESS